MDWIAVCRGKLEKKIDLCGYVSFHGGIDFLEDDRAQAQGSLTSLMASFLPWHALGSIVQEPP